MYFGYGIWNSGLAVKTSESPTYQEGSGIDYAEDVENQVCNI